jgi:ATP-dependent Zn protease
MIAKTRPPLTAKLVALLAFLVCASLTPAALAAKAAPTTTQIAYQPESYAEFEKKLAAGQVQSVTINKRLRSLRITLKDGRYVLAKYKPKEETKVAAVLTGDHVPVVVLSSTAALAEVTAKPAHHKIRYIAGGVLIVVIVIVVVVLFLRRRRAAMADY